MKYPLHFVVALSLALSFASLGQSAGAIGVTDNDMAAADRGKVGSAVNMTSLPSRTEFTAAMARIQVGASADDVIRLLGKPDDIAKQARVGDLRSAPANVAEAWRYGARGPHSMATLGVVFFDSHQQVYHLSIDPKRAPPREGMFDESELRTLLQLIDNNGQRTSAADFDPQKLIIIVNALQAQGEERAVALLNEYMRLKFRALPGRQTVPLIARALFDPPDAGGVMPRLVAGLAIPAPVDPKQFPRFPLMVADGVPFIVVRGYVLGGRPIADELDFAEIQRTCRFRAAPLHPTAALAKLASDATTQASLLGDEQLTTDVANQFLRLTSTVFTPKPRVDEGRILFHDFDSWWKQVQEDLAPLKVSWDAQRNVYVKGR